MTMTLPVDALFWIGLGLIALIAFLCGWLVFVRGQSTSAGFQTTLWGSGVAFIALVVWFDGAAKERFMGTIPFVLNVSTSILAYGLLILASFLFFRFSKRKKRVN